ncbi:EndoU domain-containing protein [Myxococcus sp. K15C18031901]|uniref:EndoU domain-containing protein n=1 Tax=Myxococcus dinghuensis TaxID=2906761 RepID=UPI0020A72193|nr:EndoU domain-containing protein [Myxococcus dinghuensis]MCP3101316.1 EndoU domain-containing protein [Myxococcus dinghuensis]
MRPSALCLAVLLSALPALAGPGAFVSDVRVDAVEQPESPRVVFTVEPGTSYPLLKKGGPDRAWCKLRGTTAEGWVLCEGAPESAMPERPSEEQLVAADRADAAQRAEGRERLRAEFAAQRAEKPQDTGLAQAGGRAGAGAGAPAPTDDDDLGPTVEVAAPAAQAPRGPITVTWKPATGCATTCSRAPLFAKSPALSDMDRAVLDLCPARPDTSVSAGDVRRFVARHVNDPRLQLALSAAGRPGARQANIDWLTSLWVGTGPRNAFTHVFCGDDWDRGPIGGLHFLPRYAQLEAQGKVCYGGPVSGGAAKRGGQYLIRYQGVAPWSCGEKKVGGFTESPDAVGLLSIGTRAFARCCARDGAKKEGGVYAAKDLGGTNWRIWCGTRNGTYGIATLHPTDDAATCGE